jgi:hypothetical protein
MLYIRRYVVQIEFSDARTILYRKIRRRTIRGRTIRRNDMTELYYCNELSATNCPRRIVLQRIVRSSFWRKDRKPRRLWVRNRDNTFTGTQLIFSHSTNFKLSFRTKTKYLVFEVNSKITLWNYFKKQQNQNDLKVKLSNLGLKKNQVTFIFLWFSLRWNIDKHDRISSDSYMFMCITLSKTENILNSCLITNCRFGSGFHVTCGAGSRLQYSISTGYT